MSRMIGGGDPGQKALPMVHRLDKKKLNNVEVFHPNSFSTDRCKISGKSQLLQ